MKASRIEKILIFQIFDCVERNDFHGFQVDVSGIIKLMKGSDRLKGSNNLFKNGDVVHLKNTGETVTILKWQYVKHMKTYSYIVAEHPKTFFFENEFKKD